jgi:hypothetical protein
MPSRLSSLLVRDGLVGVKRMEKAFQRQVIYGGSLDTILLEIALVPEVRLTQYLALASGLPPAARDEGAKIDPAALALLAAELAQQFRAVPLSIDGEALRVLVCSPLEMTELEDLADLLDRPLQPLITPEYRWHLAFATAYGTDAPARFTTLARTLEISSAPEPVGRARSIIVDNTHPMVTETHHALVRNDVPMPVGSDDSTTKVDIVIPDEPRSRHSTLVGVQPAPKRKRNDGVPDDAIVRPTVTFTPSTGVPIVVEDSDKRRVASVPIVTAGRDSPLAIVRARELLATADDRDTVFLTLLRATRARARYAGLLTVQGGAAIGRVALAEIGIDTAAIASVLIPLDVVSPFRSVVNSQQPHIGSLASSDAGIDAMMSRLGGTVPPSALLMPIVLRDRAVAIVVAHRGHSDLKLVDVAELLPLAGATADALGRLIVRHKAAGYRAATEAESGPVEVEGERVVTKRHRRVDVDWSVAEDHEPPTVPELDDAPELSYIAEPPRTIEDVVDEIEHAREGGAEDAITDAVERGGETLGVLMRRFPGTLRVDRFAVQGRSLRAAQYGGLLDLVVRLGSAASELLVEKMGSAQRDDRFFATICAAELRPRSAIFALVERLFDQDYGVRAAAIEALAGYPVAELTQSLARARRAVHSTDPEIVAAATTAIVALGDIEAVGDLIASLERTDKGTEHVRKALVALTAQDFGTNEKKWRKWFEGARKSHRIEWLIDGLTHKEDAIREGAIQDLRRLTGEYFGYHHDLPRKERDVAAERWTVWWRETGQRRFVFKDDERHRPTAVLPGRTRGE